MDVFQFRDRLIEDYEGFSHAFTQIRAEDIRGAVEAAYRGGRFWPAPLIQINQIASQAVLTGESYVLTTGF